MFAPRNVFGVDEERLTRTLIIVLNVDVGEEHRPERTVEEWTERKRWIVAFASCGEKDDTPLFVREMIVESLIEKVHFFFPRKILSRNTLNKSRKKTKRSCFLKRVLDAYRFCF